MIFMATYIDNAGYEYVHSFHSDFPLVGGRRGMTYQGLDLDGRERSSFTVFMLAAAPEYIYQETKGTYSAMMMLQRGNAWTDWR